MATELVSMASRAQDFTLKLNSARLSRADLESANLNSTFAQSVDFRLANLKLATFRFSKLNGANVTGANLSFADFSAADLTNALLVKRDLTGVVFKDAVLRGANLSETTGLTQEAVDEAIGDENTILPEGIQMPNSWREVPQPVKQTG